MIQINPYKTQEMYAGAAGSSSLMFGAGQQAGVQGAGAAQGSVGGINTGSKPYENVSLVDRLDRIDAGAVRPSTGGANSVDGYDSELAAQGLIGVTGESIFVGQTSKVGASDNNFASLVGRLNNMDYEMHPDTRDEFRGNRLYLEG